MKLNKKSISFLVCILVSIIYIFFMGQATEGTINYQKIVVDANGPIDPWGKAVGDINGDGFIDIIVGGHSPPKPRLWRRVLSALHFKHYAWPTEGSLYWYESPSWDKHLVSDKFRFRTDHDVADIDMDGRNDIVSATDTGLIWFRNPDWAATKIDSRQYHDVETADFDGDGDLDIVARNQRIFGHNDGDRMHFYRQDSPSRWLHIEINIPQGEGLAVADMNGDSRPDVIVSGAWYRNPGELSVSVGWDAMPYCPTWTWPDAFIDISDMNQDGRLDIVLAPAEPAGDSYRLAWCESLDTEDVKWREHIIDPHVESVVHSVRAGDFNNDGLMDVVTAEMVEGHDPDAVTIYMKESDGAMWEKEILSNTGSHSMRVFDFDNDGDLDLFGANWTGSNQAIELWVNQKKK